MSSLHFGFEEYRYPDGMTTVDVGAILEDQYHIVETFLELYKPEIQQMMVEATYENPSPGDVPLPAVVGLFHQFLDSGEIERLGIPGIPTDASRSTVKTKSARPSFVHTGLYRDSFRAWLEL